MFSIFFTFNIFHIFIEKSGLVYSLRVWVPEITILLSFPHILWKIHQKVYNILLSISREMHTKNTPKMKSAEIIGDVRLWIWFKWLCSRDGCALVSDTEWNTLSVNLRSFKYVLKWNYFQDILDTKGFQELLNYPNDSFDLIIHDFIGGPCVVPFVHKFKNASLVIVTTFSNPPFLANIMGSRQNYAYVPHIALPFSSNMSFWQRFVNFSFLILEH